MSKFEKQFEFSEILEKTLNSESEISHDPAMDDTAGWSSALDPMHLSYLLGNLDIETNLFPSPSKNPYLKYKKIVQRPFHKLTQAQETALEFINHFLPVTDPLLGNFTLQQLKRSYKKAAFKAHPDCGGTHESFLSLKNDYEMLLAFLHSIK